MHERSIRENLTRLAGLADVEAPEWSSFDLSKLPIDSGADVDPMVQSYFAACVPSDSLETWTYFFWSPDEIAERHADDGLGQRLGAADMVGFGGTDSGDLLVLDVASGACLELEHAVTYDDEIRGRAQILEHESERHGSLQVFLETVIAQFKRQLVEDGVHDAAFFAEAETDPMAKDDEGRLPIHRKVQEGDIEGIIREIDRGAPLTKPAEHIDSPVEWAIAWSQPEALRVLLQRGAPADASAIVLAAEGFEYECLDVLLAAGIAPGSLKPDVLEELMEDEEVAARLTGLL